MAIYIVNTPSGKRLIEAKSSAAAINFVLDKDSYTAEAVNAATLNYWYEQGLKVEKTVPESKSVTPPAASVA